MRRQFHSKSRNGCQACKLRRVKIPSCANCVIRKIRCIYLQSRTQEDITDFSNSATASTDHRILPSEPPSIVLPTSVGNALDEIIDLSSNEITNLELMHRWTLETWKAFVTMDEEEAFLRDRLPRIALTHDFLLYGMFSVTALDILANTQCPNPRKYISLALKYSNESSALFRRQLNDMKPEDCHAFFTHSVFTLAANVMIPHYFPSQLQPLSTALDAVKAFFTLARGACEVVAVFPQAFLEKAPYVMRVVNALRSSHRLAKADEREAIALLHQVNKDLNSVVCNDNEAVGDASNSAHDVYHDMIKLLETCYAEDNEGDIKALCLSAPGLASNEFIEALGSFQPLAILILMHWAVLLGRSSRDFWWTSFIGEKLIEETLPLLQQTAIMETSNMPQHLYWLKHQAS